MKSQEPGTRRHRSEVSRSSARARRVGGPCAPFLSPRTSLWPEELGELCVSVLSQVTNGEETKLKEGQATGEEARRHRAAESSRAGNNCGGRGRSGGSNASR